MRRTEFLTGKRNFQELTAEVLMEQEVVSCKPSDSGCHIASQLTKFGFGSLPVVDDDGSLVGLVSEFDVLKVLMEGRDPNRLKGKCGICEFRHICEGCRARAYGMTGDYLAEEPFCIYQPSLPPYAATAKTPEAGHG